MVATIVVLWDGRFILMIGIETTEAHRGTQRGTAATTPSPPPAPTSDVGVHGGEMFSVLESVFS
jgi:hypothetical protein